MTYHDLLKRRRQGRTRRQRKAAAERALRRGLLMWAALSPYQRAVSKAFGFTPRCFGYNPGAASAVHQEQRRAMLVAGQETYAEHMQRTAREFAEQHGLPAPIVTTRTE